jgi:translin
MDNNETAERYLDAMDSIYQVIMSFDYPNAISLGLRSRSDAARGMVERTRGDLTTALRAGRLEKRMKELRRSWKVLSRLIRQSTPFLPIA